MGGGDGAPGHSAGRRRERREGARGAERGAAGRCARLAGALDPLELELAHLGPVGALLAEVPLHGVEPLVDVRDAVALALLALVPHAAEDADGHALEAVAHEAQVSARERLVLDLEKAPGCGVRKRGKRGLESCQKAGRGE